MPEPDAAPADARPRLEIDRYFEALVKLEGGDLHMKIGQPAIIRVKGALQPLKAPKVTLKGIGVMG